MPYATSSTPLNSSKKISTFVHLYSIILHSTSPLHAFPCTLCICIKFFLLSFLSCNAFLAITFTLINMCTVHSLVTIQCYKKSLALENYTSTIWHTHTHAAVATNWCESERTINESCDFNKTQHFLFSSDKSTSTGVYSFHLCLVLFSHSNPFSICSLARSLTHSLTFYPIYRRFLCDPFLSFSHIARNEMCWMWNTPGNTCLLWTKLKSKTKDRGKRIEQWHDWIKTPRREIETM